MAAEQDIRRRQKRPSLCCPTTPPPPIPTDLIVEIAGRTDPATLVRCAATCRDLRRHIADPSLRRRLRLRHGDRFVPSLLRGHLVGKWDKDLYLYPDDSTTAAGGGARNPIATGWFRRRDDKELSWCWPIAACGGLVLVRVRVMKTTNQLRALEMRVCDPATGRTQTLPRPGPPAFEGQHVLLAGGGAVGPVRPFRVLKVGSVLSKQHGLLIQTFSSERGTWGPRIMAPSPFETSCRSMEAPGKHLVAGDDAVHWLCRNGASYYVLKLVDDGETAPPRLTSTKLPPSFHREYSGREFPRPAQVLLASAASGSPAPAVLVARDSGRISAWTTTTLSSEHAAAGWTDRPHVVVVLENGAINRMMINAVQEKKLGRVRLEWFAERSGIVLVSTAHCGCFWLDLR